MVSSIVITDVFLQGNLDISRFSDWLRLGAGLHEDSILDLASRDQVRISHSK